jgi:hypothetical protein
LPAAGANGSELACQAVFNVTAALRNASFVAGLVFSASSSNLNTSVSSNYTADLRYPALSMVGSVLGQVNRSGRLQGLGQVVVSSLMLAATADLACWV